MDFTCSFHIYVNKESFDRYKPCDAGNVVMANGSRSKVISMGTTKTKMFNGGGSLRYMRHVPNLRKNLVSLDWLNILGCDFSTKNEFVEVAKGSLVIMRGKNK